jgi:hypothetical protein
MSSKVNLTLEGMLDAYFYKDEIQDLLSQYGEKTAGNKDEMIARLLKSKRVQGMSVTDFARSALSGLTMRELRLVCKDLGLTSSADKGACVDNILDSVEFEPFVLIDERPCDVCKKITSHELHFSQDWKLAFFVCQTCRTREIPESIGESRIPVERSSEERHLMQAGHTQTSEGSRKPIPEDEFLELLLKISEEEGQGPLNIFDIGGQLGMDGDLSQVVATSLSGKGYVLLGLGGSITILPKGKVRARGYRISSTWPSDSVLINTGNIISESTVKDAQVVAGDLSATATTSGESRNESALKRYEISIAVFGVSFAVATLFLVNWLGWFYGGAVAVLVGLLLSYVVFRILPRD